MTFTTQGAKLSFCPWGQLGHFLPLKFSTTSHYYIINLYAIYFIIKWPLMWFQDILSKATKFWKIVTWATNVEIRNCKYRHKARDSSFRYLPLHVNSGGQDLRQRRSKFWLESQTFLQANFVTFLIEFESFRVITTCQGDKLY